MAFKSPWWCPFASQPTVRSKQSLKVILSQWTFSFCLVSFQEASVQMTWTTSGAGWPTRIAKCSKRRISSQLQTRPCRCSATGVDQALVHLRLMRWLLLQRLERGAEPLSNSRKESLLKRIEPAVELTTPETPTMDHTVAILTSHSQMRTWPWTTTKMKRSTPSSSSHSSSELSLKAESPLRQQISSFKYSQSGTVSSCTRYTVATRTSFTRPKAVAIDRETKSLVTSTDLKRTCKSSSTTWRKSIRRRSIPKSRSRRLAAKLTRSESTVR